jgi:hypothetical protein
MSAKRERYYSSNHLVIIVCVCCNNYEGIFTRLNLSTLYSRRRHLDVVFLINVFKSKIRCSSIFYSVSIWIPTTTIRHYSAFMVNHDFKVSASCRALIYLRRIIFRWHFITLLVCRLFYCYLSVFCGFHFVHLTVFLFVFKCYFLSFTSFAKKMYSCF